MNKLLNILTILVSISSFSQIVIGSNVGSAGTNTDSVLLDFPTGENKGLILPYVTTLPTLPIEGTIILDASDATTARVKYFNENWIDLSGQDANVTTELNLQSSSIDETNSKVIIGATSSSADGVLILESTTKAMVLPIVNDVQNIFSPSPGMMVYVNKTGAKRLAVFNGNKWSFWRP